MSGLNRWQARHRSAEPKCPTREASNSGGQRWRDPGLWGATASFRRKRRLMAARVRTSTGSRNRRSSGVTAGITPTQWLGLLIWAMACAGLLVSLLMESEELDRKPRLATRAIQVQAPTVPRAAPDQ
jgi:hypothetical protein